MSGATLHNIAPSQFSQMPTLGDIARYQAENRPVEIALKFEGRETSYKQFNERTNQVANALIDKDVQKGRHIAYIGKNIDFYFELLFGAAKIGVILTPINWRLSPSEIAYILKDADVELAFVDPEVADKVVQSAAELPHSLQMIYLETNSNPSSLFYTAWRDAASVEKISTTISQADVAIQLYTSGTTGRPKGAMLTHGNLLMDRQLAAEANMAWNEWGPDDVSLVALPVSHIAGTAWGITSLLHGAKCVVIREFDAAKVLELIEAEHVSKMFIVPSALQMLVSQPHVLDIDFSRLKYIMYGASPIPLDLLVNAMNVFKCGFCQQYGMTETCGTIVYLPPEDHDLRGAPLMRAAGLPMPGVSLKILDDHGEALGPNIVGEVLVRSSANMAGYWGLVEATGAAMTSDGWLRTGDAGYLNEDGYLFIHDRMKDMIISGAENIYPAEVENAIYGHPDVAEVAVIGIPDDRWGEAVKAMVVLKPGASTEPENIIAFARSRIAHFKAPKSIDFINALPRNASGKILRRQLREPFWAARDRQIN